MPSSTPRSSQKGAAPPDPPRVFISYVHHDSKDVCAELVRELEAEFGPESVAYDDRIRPGDDIAATHARWLESCRAFLCLIGPQWREQVAKRPPDKFLIHELVTAMQRAKADGLRLIPVLIDDTEFPKDLPSRLRDLRSFTACSLHVVRPAASHPGTGLRLFQVDLAWIVAALAAAGLQRKRHPKQSPEPSEPSLSTNELTELAWLLVADFHAAHDLLLHFDHTQFLAGIAKLEQVARLAPESAWGQRLHRAMSHLQSKRGGQTPNLLWRAWTLKTQSHRIEALRTPPQPGRKPTS